VSCASPETNRDKNVARKLDYFSAVRQDPPSPTPLQSLFYFPNTTPAPPRPAPPHSEHGLLPLAISSKYCLALLPSETNATSSFHSHNSTMRLEARRSAAYLRCVRDMCSSAYPV